jgi:hypothetical protein
MLLPLLFPKKIGHACLAEQEEDNLLQKPLFFPCSRLPDGRFWGVLTAFSLFNKFSAQKLCILPVLFTLLLKQKADII